MARADIVRAIMNELLEGLDILVLHDGVFTGTNADAQDRIDLADYGFDDDEIMLFYDLDVPPDGLSSGALEALNDHIGIALSMNKSATPGSPQSDDIPFFHLHMNVRNLGQLFVRKSKFPSPVPIIDHFWLHNEWVSGGGDGSGENMIWIYYKKVKLTPGRMRDAIRLLRMAG